MVSLEQQVARASSPREALMLIARAVDELRSQRAPTLDTWDGWVPDQAPAATGVSASEQDSSPPPPAPEITEDVVRSWIARNYGREPADDVEGRALIAQVKRDLETAPNLKQVGDLFRITTEGIIESEIDWAPLSEKHRAARYDFAKRVLNLDVALGDHPMGGDWAADYAKGGPMWFYIPNRDLVMQYPEHVRSQMVEDVRLYGNAKVTHEFGADVLKKPMSTDIEGRGAPQPMGLSEDQL